MFHLIANIFTLIQSHYALCYGSFDVYFDMRLSYYCYKWFLLVVIICICQEF